MSEESGMLDFFDNVCYNGRDSPAIIQFVRSS